VRQSVVAHEVVVDDQHVGPKAVELAIELGGVRGDGGDRQVGFGLDQPPQAGQHRGVIVQDGDAQHCLPVCATGTCPTMGWRPHVNALRDAAQALDGLAMVITRRARGDGELDFGAATVRGTDASLR
jgi:hypothetical protein